MSETLVRVDLADRSYDIVIGGEVLSSIATRLSGIVKKGARRVFVLTDENVWDNHGDALKSHLATGGMEAIANILPAGEATKSFANLQSVLEWSTTAAGARAGARVVRGGAVEGTAGGSEARGGGRLGC